MVTAERTKTITLSAKFIEWAKANGHTDVLASLNAAREAYRQVTPVGFSHATMSTERLLKLQARAEAYLTKVNAALAARNGTY